MAWTRARRKFAVAGVLACALFGAACGEASPPDSGPDVPLVTRTARSVALRYNRALSGGNCEAARDLGGKNMGPDSSFAQWCEPTDYSPGARGIRLKIERVQARVPEAVVVFTQRMCLIGAQSGDPQTRVYSGRWWISIDDGLIVREERRETGSQFDCEPPLLGDGS
jgi:hypothetical protein